MSSLLRFVNGTPERAKFQATGSLEENSFDAARKKLARLKSVIEEKGGFVLEKNPDKARQDEVDRYHEAKTRNADNISKQLWKCSAEFKERPIQVQVEVTYFKWR